MEHQEGRFRGQENLTLYYQYWLPATDSKAVLLLVHGIGDHSDYWANLVNHFVPEGYAVCGYDHRGHGKSEGLGGYVEKFQYYVDDLKTFVEIVRGEYVGTKIFMVGISMGGLIATTYSTEYQHELSGLLLAGPLLTPESVCSPLLMPLARLLSLPLPKLGVEALDLSAISQDKTAVDTALNDPLVYKGKNTARLGAELLKATQKLSVRMPEITLPLLIMHGTADRICSPEGSKTLYELASSKDKTLKLYEGFYHEIFNEPQREQVFTDIQEWLSAHIGG